MRIFFILVGICFVWLSSAYYVLGHALTPLLPGDFLIQKEGALIYLPFLTSIIAGVLMAGGIAMIRKMLPLMHKAPAVLLGIVFIAVMVLVWYGYQLRTGLFACNREHQLSLDTLMAQSQTVLANHKDGCTQSYEVLTDWDLCTEKADQVVPVPFQRMLRPLVSNVMMFFREKTKDIDVLKRDHDERCQGYTELMFYPPVTE